MTSLPRALRTLVLVAAALAAAPALAADSPPEPDGFRTGEYRAPVPETLTGAAVVDPDRAHALWEDDGTVFVDVLPRPPKPDNLPEGTVWRDKTRNSIPGAVWLANTGFGALNPAIEDWFRAHLERLTGGDPAQPMLFFCLADCWMSWNAAKRAVGYGYTEILWFPEGTDGWAAAGHPLEEVEPEPFEGG